MGKYKVERLTKEEIEMIHHGMFLWKLKERKKLDSNDSKGSKELSDKIKTIYMKLGILGPT